MLRDEVHAVDDAIVDGRGRIARRSARGDLESLSASVAGAVARAALPACCVGFREHRRNRSSVLIRRIISLRCETRGTKVPLVLPDGRDFKLRQIYAGLHSRQHGVANEQ